MNTYMVKNTMWLKLQVKTSLIKLNKNGLYIYAKNICMLEYSPDSKSIQILTNSSLLFIPSGCEVFNWCCHHPSFRFLALISPLEISIPMIEMFSNAHLP